MDLAGVADPTLDRQHEMRERLKTLNIPAGKIHTIPNAYKIPYGADGASGVQVNGLHKSMLRLGETGEGLADQNIPWANKSVPVSATEVHHLDLAAFV